LIVDPTGRFVYATNNASNDISAYVIDSNTGALTPVSGSPFAAGGGAFGGPWGIGISN
jgi:6-phosphogluconolactonase (cycloisomerase 2 family)